MQAYALRATVTLALSDKAVRTPYSCQGPRRASAGRRYSQQVIQAEHPHATEVGLGVVALEADVLPLRRDPLGQLGLRGTARAQTRLEGHTRSGKTRRRLTIPQSPHGLRETTQQLPNTCALMSHCAQIYHRYTYQSRSVQAANA